MFKEKENAREKVTIVIKENQGVVLNDQEIIAAHIIQAGTGKR